MYQSFRDDFIKKPFIGEIYCRVLSRIVQSYSETQSNAFCKIYVTDTNAYLEQRKK